MNIREIEQQLGIPRANVRYYEKEGLLHPQRSANNYRVYTEEDVETLKKIRLLRQLDMPVETIRAVMPEWDPSKKYKVPGTYSKTDKAIIFDLKKGVPYARGEHKKKGEATEE